MFIMDGVSFLYSAGRGVDSVSLRLEPGEILGVMGANGAGKSTLLALAAGVMRPQQGRITLSGAAKNGRGDVYDAAVDLDYRRNLGYLTESCPVYAELSVRRYLAYRAQLKGERYMRIRRRVTEAIERAGLREIESERLRGLSAGYRKRVALAEAIVLLPRLLVLDDPFAGLDVTMRPQCAQLIQSLADRCGVLLSGHDADMMGACCTRFAVMRKSRLLGDDYTRMEALALMQAHQQKQEVAPCQAPC